MMQTTLMFFLRFLSVPMLHCTFKWEDTIKNITQVYLQQIRIKKIQIIIKTNSYMHTIISGKTIYNQLQFIL